MADGSIVGKTPSGVVGKTTFNKTINTLLAKVHKEGPQIPPLCLRVYYSIV